METPTPLSGAVEDRLGRPLEDLRISVIDRCNFRCSFCMPAGHDYSFLPQPELLTFEEIEKLARVFVSLGVTKIRLTGGEPLLRREIELLIEMLAAIPGLRDLALTTNGALLAEKAGALKAAGLQRVTVSLPSLNDDTFAQMNGLGYKVKDVLTGIDAAMQAGLGPVKINLVVVKGVNEDEISSLARFFKDRGQIVRFIEYMDVGTLNQWDPSRVVPAREIVDSIGSAMPLTEIRRERTSDPARRFRYLDGGGEIGVIASVTQPFCGDCSRARLSADGQLYTCLFAAQGHDIKSLLRQGADAEELEALISKIWGERLDRYSEERSGLLQEENAGDLNRRIEMFRIGG